MGSLHASGTPPKRTRHPRSRPRDGVRPQSVRCFGFSAPRAALPGATSCERRTAAWGAGPTAPQDRERGREAHSCRAAGNATRPSLASHRGGRPHRIGRERPIRGRSGRTPRRRSTGNARHKLPYRSGARQTRASTTRCRVLPSSCFPSGGRFSLTSRQRATVRRRARRRSAGRDRPIPTPGDPPAASPAVRPIDRGVSRTTPATDRTADILQNATTQPISAAGAVPWVPGSTVPAPDALLRRARAVHGRTKRTWPIQFGDVRAESKDTTRHPPPSDCSCRPTHP